MSDVRISDQELGALVRQACEERARPLVSRRSASFPVLWSKARARKESGPGFAWKWALTPAFALAAIVLFLQIRRGHEMIDPGWLMSSTSIKLPSDGLLRQAERTYAVQTEFPSDSLKWRSP